MSKKSISKAKQEKILEQAIKELKHSRAYKEKHVLPRWKRNDKILAGERKKIESVRSNINITYTKGKGFVNTLMSKVDSEPNIKFSKGEDADLKKAQRTNALFAQDSAPANGNWAFKGLAGKKHGTKYGRTIFEYHASSIGGYKSILTLVHPRKFHIDPEAGGIDIERANWLGREGIKKNAKQLRAGKKKKTYISRAVDVILRDDFGKTEDEEATTNPEENRYITLRGTEQKLQRDDEWNFIEWGTTFEGERYYILFNEDSKEAIDLTLFTDKFESGLWNYATYATDPDDEEFWTDAPFDAVIELFMGQDVLVNQQLDNNEQINQPMKGYDVNAIKNPSMLKWRRNGNIPFKKGTNMDRAFKVFTPTALPNNVETYNLLDNISQVESGISGDTKGLSEQDTLGIYQGNLQQQADRLGLLNKSYADCYNRLGLLYYKGLKEHLNGKAAVQRIGSKGIEFEEITKSDIVPAKREFNISVSSADVNLNNDTTESKNKLDFLAAYKDDPTKNQNAMFEIQAEIVGFDQDQVRRLQDPENSGDAEIIAQSANDFQKMLGGEVFEEPYQGATTGYKQYMVVELRNLSRDIKPEIEATIIAYIESLEDVVVKNTVRQAKEQITSEALTATAPEAPQA